MSAPIFVDTNILVYARQENERLKQPVAAQWMERLWQEQLGRLSLQVLSEYYVTVTRKIKPRRSAADAWDDVRDFFQLESAANGFRAVTACSRSRTAPPAELVG